MTARDKEESVEKNCDSGGGGACSGSSYINEASCNTAKNTI